MNRDKVYLAGIYVVSDFKYEGYFMYRNTYDYVKTRVVYKDDNHKFIDLENYLEYPPVHNAVEIGKLCVREDTLIPIKDVFEKMEKNSHKYMRKKTLVKTMAPFAKFVTEHYRNK